MGTSILHSEATHHSSHTDQRQLKCASVKLKLRSEYRIRAYRKWKQNFIISHTVRPLMRFLCHFHDERTNEKIKRGCRGLPFESDIIILIYYSINRSSQHIFYTLYIRCISTEQSFFKWICATQKLNITLKFTFTIPLHNDKRLSAGNGAKKKCHLWHSSVEKKKRRKINNANLQTWNRFWFDLIEYQFQALKESIYLFFLINLLCYAVAVCSVHCAGYNSLSQHASMPFTYTLYTYDFHVNAKDSKNSFAHIFIYSCKSVAINFSICTRIWNRV